MKRTTMLVSVALVTIAFIGTASEAGPTGKPEAFIVGFHDDPMVREGDRLHGALVTHANLAIDFVRVEAGDGQAFAAQAASGGYRYVQRDVALAPLFVPNDPLQDDQWAWGSGIAAMDAYPAWDTTRGAGSTVAVLDSGFDTDHPDLPAPAGAADFTGSGTIEDCDGHGTHVAGTVAALTDNGVGVAGTSDADLLVGRVLDCAGSGSFTWLANAIVWAADQGADVISMSLGCSFNGCFHQATSDALAYAEAQGVLNVCAAGNSGPKGNSVEFPGNDPGCMAVSNLAEGGLSFSSSTGPEVEIAAPGSGIVSTYIGGGYASLSGTSMAAPHVSGTAALVKAVNPALGGADLRAILKATAYDSSLSADQEGSGILKASAAVAAAATWDGGDTGGGDTGSGDFTLSANGYKSKGVQMVDLAWSGSAAASFDVYRDGTVVATVGGSSHTDDIGKKGGGSYVYKVCEAATSTCTASVTVTF